MPVIPFGPVRDVDRRVEVVHEDADDLAEAERDDREVVAAQLQRRRAEQDAGAAGDEGAERDHDPPRRVQAAGNAAATLAKVSVSCGDASRPSM